MYNILSSIKRIIPSSARSWLNLAVRDPINDYFDDKRLRQAVKRGELIRVEVGKSRVAALPGWYRTNVNTLNLWKNSDWERLFQTENRVQAIFAEHVLEHIAPKLLSPVLQNCYRYLVPGGRLRISVPDGNNPDPEYIAFVEPGGIGPAADDHRSLFTVQSLGIYLSGAGFKIERIEYYDETGVFHKEQYDIQYGVISRYGKPPPYRSLNMDAIKPGS